VDEAFVTATPAEVRALIASLWLDEDDGTMTVGRITLAPHQRTALTRILAAFEDFGGCLLCDVVGAGKTFVGAAIAARYPNSVIVAPAALRTMWTRAQELAEIDATFISTESLSRSRPSLPESGVLIVDEAHHFRNANTQRHERLSRLIRGREVLLMTATPVHNARLDIETLLGLFLGERARHLREAELGRLIVRREKNQVLGSAFIPTTSETQWMTIGDNPAVVEAILSLPPPVPAREAGEAQFLVAHGLLRQWCSSQAALAAALRRRLTRGVALEASLESGHRPSEHELRSWIADDETVQLNFAGLFGSQELEWSTLIEAVRLHGNAIRALLLLLRKSADLDDARAERLSDIASRHPATQVIAFTSYEATARALYERLPSTMRAALVSSSGGRVAGGRISRAEILRQFDPQSLPAPAAERIDFLLTTDLLSEGVNLQRAGVVVHLDLPWTPARLEQRVGRVARMGSSHRSVAIYGLSPPATAEGALRTCTILLQKWRAASATIGATEAANFGGLVTDVRQRAATSRERIRDIVGSWRDHASPRPRDDQRARIAAVEADEDGFLALLESVADVKLVGAIGAQISEAPRELERLLLASSSAECVSTRDLAQRTITQLEEWIRSQAASDSAGLTSSAFLRIRRRSMRKLDALALRIPSHSRSSRRELLESARTALISSQCHADENEIERLTREGESIGDDEWLRRISTVNTTRKNERRGAMAYRIRAIIILCSTTPPPSS
jgi:superfamily II DNA or RNA helicase